MYASLSLNELSESVLGGTTYDLHVYLQGHLLMTLAKNGTKVASGNRGTARDILRMQDFNFV